MLAFAEACTLIQVHITTEYQKLWTLKTLTDVKKFMSTSKSVNACIKYMTYTAYMPGI